MRHRVRPWPHQAHVAQHDVDELRQLVERGLAQEGAERGDAGVVPAGVGDEALAFAVAEVGVHGAELEDAELLAVEADAGLAEEDRALGGQLDRDRDGQEEGGDRDQEEGAQDPVFQGFQEVFALVEGAVEQAQGRAVGIGGDAAQREGTAVRVDAGQEAHAHRVAAELVEQRGDALGGGPGECYDHVLDAPGLEEAGQPAALVGAERGVELGFQVAQDEGVRVVLAQALQRGVAVGAVADHQDAAEQEAGFLEGADRAGQRQADQHQEGCGGQIPAERPDAGNVGGDLGEEQDGHAQHGGQGPQGQGVADLAAGAVELVLGVEAGEREGVAGEQGHAQEEEGLGRDEARAAFADEGHDQGAGEDREEVGEAQEVGEQDRGEEPAAEAATQAGVREDPEAVRSGGIYRTRCHARPRADGVVAGCAMFHDRRPRDRVISGNEANNLQKSAGKLRPAPFEDRQLFL